MNLEYMLQPQQLQSAAVIGTTAYVASAALRGIRQGYTMQSQLSDRVTVAIGVATAEAVLYAPALGEFMVAAVMGAAAGVVINTVGRALTTPDSVKTDLKKRAQKGLVAGAIVAPLAFPLLDKISASFPR